MSTRTWPAGVDSTLTPLVAATPSALTALVYAVLALRPDLFGDDARLLMVGIGFAEYPLLLLDCIFVAVLGLEASTKERLLIGAVSLLVICGGFLGVLIFDPILGPMLGWTVLAHALALARPGEDRALRVARGEALCRDAGAQISLSIMALAAAAVVFVAEAYMTGGEVGGERVWNWIGIVGCIHFAVRAASIGYVHRRAFATNPKGLLDQPWLRWLDREKPRPQPVRRPAATVGARRGARRRR